MTSKYVGAATIATSLLWTLGTRTNSNLIEGISRNNDSYSKQFWVSNLNLIESRRLINKIVKLLENTPEALAAALLPSHAPADLAAAADLASYLASDLASVYIILEFVAEAKDTENQQQAQRSIQQAIQQAQQAQQSAQQIALYIHAPYVQKNTFIGIAKEIQSLLNSKLAIEYYNEIMRPGKLPHSNQANVTNNALDFIMTSPNYYTKDSGAMKTTQSNQLDCLAYSTQAVSGLTALQTDNPLYLLLNLIPLTILSYDITRNYLNLEKGILEEKFIPLKSPSNVVEE